MRFPDKEYRLLRKQLIKQETLIKKRLELLLQTPVAAQQSRESLVLRLLLVWLLTRDLRQLTQPLPAAVWEAIK